MPVLVGYLRVGLPFDYPNGLLGGSVSVAVEVVYSLIRSGMFDSADHGLC